MLAVAVRLATAPARLLGRFRPDLAIAAADDLTRFGSAAAVFLALALLAVAYAALASAVHAFGAPTQVGDPLGRALTLGFDVVYTESIPFMLAAAVLGAISPSLGLLFMVVFIPADLIAANGTAELANNQYSELPYPAIVARLASLGWLWILAVEIPITGRRIATRLSGGMSRSGRGLRLAIANAIVIAFLAYLWTSVIGLMIISVYTWTNLQQFQTVATDPTWYYWPILVAGAAVAAFISALWPGLPHLATAGVSVAPVTRAAPAAPAAPILARLLARDTLASLVLAALLGALMTGPAAALVVGGGLLLAGPGLTLILRALPRPAVLRRASGDMRWVIAVSAAIATTFVLTALLWDALDLTSDLGFALAVVLVINVFRLVRDVGAGSEPTPRPVPAGVPA